MELELVMLSQTFWSGLILGSIYALIALGFTLIYNVSKVLNMAQGEFIMVGAMAFYSFVTMLEVPLMVSLLVAAGIAALVGLGTVKVALHRSAKQASPVQLIIITIAIGEIIKGLALLIWGKDTVGIPAMAASGSVEIMGAMVPKQGLIILGSALVICILFSLLMSKTNLGKAMLASSGDAYAAQLVGIDVKKLMGFAFGMSAILGSLAGVLVGPLTMMNYTQGTLLGIKGFIAALLGGMGSYPGAVLGAVLLGQLESFGSGYISSLLKDAFSFAVLLLVLLVKPTGIIRSKLG